MTLYDTIAPILAAITTQRLTCQRCHREIVVPMGDDWVPCHHCRAELGTCTGDEQTSVAIRKVYDGATVDAAAPRKYNLGLCGLPTHHQGSPCHTQTSTQRTHAASANIAPATWYASPRPRTPPYGLGPRLLAYPWRPICAAAPSWSHGQPRARCHHGLMEI